MNNNGLSTDPCGTPLVTLADDEDEQETQKCKWKEADQAF